MYINICILPPLSAVRRRASFFVDIWGCFEDIQVLFRGYEGLHKYIHICKYDIFVLVHVLPQLRKHVYNEKYIIYTYMNIYV